MKGLTRFPLLKALLALGCFTAVNACYSDAPQAAKPSGAPVVTAPPNAEAQTPAFPAQTRAPQVDSGVPVKTEVVASGLRHPWGVQFLPDGRLLITERPGQLRVVTQQGKVSEPLTGVPEVFAQGQGGLLDVSVSPHFSKDRWVYLSYAGPTEGGKSASTVARGRLNENATGLEQVEVIFQQTPAVNSRHHFGSRLVWSPEGLLYITLGDRGREARGDSQDPNTHIGKVLRVKADGSPPADNPFAPGGGLPEVWSYGHRNVQSAAIHPDTGALWTLEHGPRGGDELNRPEAGKNYGWPAITYGEDYSGAPIGQGETAKPGMEQPLYYFDPVIAPGGMTFYTGELFKQWQGDLLVSSMNPGAVVRLVLEGDKVVGEERLVNSIGRVRDLTQGPEGAVWLITDAEDGKLIRLYR